MELIIDKNGKAVDLEDVSVTIICESKEEADQMKEGMASGRARLIEWHPIEIRDCEKTPREGEKMPIEGEKMPGVIGELPEDGQMVLVSVICARGKRGVTTDVFCIDQEGSYFEDWDWSQVAAWAPMPHPYEKRED